MAGKQGKGILATVAVLFVLWSVWLAYAAWKYSDPIVVSRVQVLLSTFILQAEVGEIKNNLAEVKVLKILKDDLRGERKEIPQTVFVRWPDTVAGWKGPGTYVLMLHNGNLQHPAAAAFSLVPNPRQNEVPIYRWTESVAKQIELAIDGAE